MLLTLWSYSWYTDKPGIFRYSLVFISLSLGLMAKPMLVTVPVVLLLLDFWPIRRFGNQLGKGNWALVWEKVPLLAPCIVSGVLTWNAQKLMLAINSLDAMPLSKRIPNAIMSYAIYITKMFWPSRLGNYYPQPMGGWPEEQVALAVLGLAVVTYFCIRKVASRPYLLTGWLWYVITLVPVIGLAQVGGQARADRYTYVPLIGLFLIIAFIVPDLLLRVNGSGEPRTSPWLARSLGVAAVAVIVALSMVTYVQIGYWEDGIIAARRAIAVTEDNWFELQSLGSQLEDSAEEMGRRGKRDEAMKLAGEAITQLQASLAITPGCVDAHNDLGRALALTGDREGAISEYLAAIELNPRHLLSHNNLGNTYIDLRRYEDAIDQYQQALEIDERNIYANYNLGIAYQLQGDIDAALEQFLRVLELQPNDYFAYWARYNAAIFSRQKGNADEATRLLQEAVEVNRVAGVDPGENATKYLSNIESH
jgi:tetratricopeptide (TPR) repeat protein